MSASLSLPLFPPGPLVGQPLAGAEAVGQRSGVEYLDLGVRSVLNRAQSPRLPFKWTINPYRGCEIGCTYCYARDGHGFFDLDRWQDFETKIFVKKRAARALEARLRKVALQGEPIAIGTVTDPYQPAERHFGVTRSLLEVFDRVEGLQISLSTKSPLVLRDLDLLEALDRKHAIRVQVSVTTLDPELARKLEPVAPPPHARIKAIRELAERGLATTLCVMPILPGLTDREAALGPLFEAAAEAGAADVIGTPLFLRPAARARFFPWLAEELPDLVPLYQRLYRRRDYLRAADRDRILATFTRLRLQHNFPRPRPGRT